MKSVLLIAIVAVAMIGVMVPSSFGETYVDFDAGFSIDYPSGWDVDDSLDFEEYGVFFYDTEDHGQWTSTFSIHKLESANYDVKTLGDLTNIADAICRDNNFEDDGLICYDFEIINKKITRDSNDLKRMMITYSHEDLYAEGGAYPTISIMLAIFDGSDVWVIFSSTDESEFEFHKENLLNSFESFKILTNAQKQEEEKRIADEKRIAEEKRIADEISNTINSSSKNTNILSKTFRTHHQQVTIEFDSWDLLPSNSEKLLVIFGKITENIDIGEQPDRFYKAPDFMLLLNNERFFAGDSELNLFEPYQQIGYYGETTSPQQLPQGRPDAHAVRLGRGPHSSARLAHRERGP